jgi:hypothetical protein
MIKETIVVNFYGGPGTGKSTMCAGVFARLKWAKVNCEMALEYAKDIVWEGSLNKLENQIYLFGKQHHRVFRLLGKVDVVLTDSPLLLSLVYGPENDAFRNFVKQEYGKMNNCDIFLHRVKEYNQAGRTQNLEDAKKIDDKLLNILTVNDSVFHTFVGEQESEEKVKDLILSILDRNK